LTQKHPHRGYIKLADLIVDLPLRIY